MKPLTEEAAIRAGGWHPRYAVVLAVATYGDVAAALVDANGDGANIDLDQYQWGPEDGWICFSSHGCGSSGLTCTGLTVTAFGKASPGEIVQLEYLGATHEATANGRGWWLFVTAPEDEETMIRVVGEEG